MNAADVHACDADTVVAAAATAATAVAVFDTTLNLSLTIQPPCRCPLDKLLLRSKAPHALLRPPASSAPRGLHGWGGAGRGGGGGAGRR